MAVTIVAEHGTHLLIADGERYAVIERRQDRFYNCHDGKRTPVDALSDVAGILDERDWTDRDSARATFDAVIQRGTDLARRML
jgi:hypothetical protein